MTVHEIIEETRQWPPSQIDELVRALLNQPTPAEPPPSDAVSSLREFSKKIDEIWSGTGISVSTEEMIASLRESRSRRE
jgi:hypothetical protein